MYFWTLSASSVSIRSIHAVTHSHTEARMAVRSDTFTHSLIHLFFRLFVCWFLCSFIYLFSYSEGHKANGHLRQTLLGYAMGHSSGPGVSKVDCLVSLVLSVNATERLRELGQLRRSIKEVRENLEIHIDNMGHRITSMQRGWRGL